MSETHSEEPSHHQLTRDDVLKVARLARLTLDESEVEEFTGQLGQVLGYVGILDEADTEGVEPLAGASERTDVLREDEPGESLARDQALSGAPRHDDRFFLVPPVLDTSAE